jgi:hypothetical protein
VRGLFLLDQVLRDLELQYSIRSIRKDLRFAIVAVFALALGIGSSTVVFSVFYNLMFNAVAARDAQRLVVPVVQNVETPEFSSQLRVSWADVKYLREHNQVFEKVVGSHSGIARAAYGTRSYQFENGHVSPDAFEFYGVPPLLGRGMVASDGQPDVPPVFVMSFPTWKVQVGSDPGIIGKSFVIEGDPATLVGVMPERFHGFGATQEIWTPVGEAQAASETEKRIRVKVLARLKRGISLAAASAELDLLTHRLAVLQPNNDDYPKKFTGRAVAANDFLMGPSRVATVFNTKPGRAFRRALDWSGFDDPQSVPADACGARLQCQKHPGGRICAESKRGSATGSGVDPRSGRPRPVSKSSGKDSRSAGCVASVAVNNNFPGYGPSGGPRVGVAGAAQDVEAGLDECDENCLSTLEMRLLSGQWLSHDEVQTRRLSAVINQTMARALFSDKNPVGQTLEVRGFKQRYRSSSADFPDKAVFEIVGVVRDTKNAGPQSPVGPMAFIPPMITGDFLVQIRTKVAPGSVMQAAVWSVDRGEVFLGLALCRIFSTSIPMPCPNLA